MFSPGSGRRDPGLSPRVAQAPAESDLRVLSKCLALFSRPHALLSLQRALAALHPLDARARLARSASRTAPRSAFSHYSPPGCAQGFYDARAHERISELSLPLW